MINPQATTTFFFVRHPRYEQWPYGQTDIEVPHSGISQMASIAKRYASLLPVKTNRPHFDHIYSSPSARCLLGGVAIHPYVSTLSDYKPYGHDALSDRLQARIDMYRKTPGWEAVGEEVLFQLASRDLRAEDKARAVGIKVLLGFHEPFEGLPTQNFHEHRRRIDDQCYSLKRIEQIVETLQAIAQFTPSCNLFIVHGGTMVFLRKYAAFLLNGRVPREASEMPYKQMKYCYPKKQLLYHGSGLILQYDTSGNIITNVSLIAN